MAKDVTQIKLEGAGLDEKSGEIIAHGWLGLDAINALLVGDYQREVLKRKITGRSSKTPKLFKALEEGARFPDIVLGMRGESFTTRGTAFYLEDDVYVVDGLQRISAIKDYAEANPHLAPDLRIGAEVRFNTTRDTEKELFAKLNMNRTPMAPSVLLRNSRDKHNSILCLYGLSTNDPKFALHTKVCWNQNMNRGELMTALTLAKAAMAVHRFAGSANLESVKYAAERLDRVVAKITLSKFRENVTTFVNAIDDMWGIRGIKYQDLNTHLRTTFLMAVGRLFSDHTNFWDGNRLVIDAVTKAKLRTFPIHDPGIQRMASGSSLAGDHLYNLLREHMNKGKRIHRLTPRDQPVTKDEDEGED